MILNFLWNESNHILYTTNKELASKLKLDPYKFYCYYSPSYLNGFENLTDKDINIHHLQAFEGLCRDEFIPKYDFFTSEFFIQEISKNEGLFTKALMDKYFDEAFDWTFDVTFLANPNFRERYLDDKAVLP